MVMNTHLCKFLCHAKYVCRSRISRAHVKSFEKYPSLQLSLISSPRYISSNAPDDQGNSFVVSYLVNNCGFSEKSALLASKRINFKTRDKPDSVLAFFKSQGFSSIQITKIIRARPYMLLSDPMNTLFPKIELFRSKGFSEPDILKICCVCPEILHCSLEKLLIPSFSLVRDLFPSDESMMHAIKRLPKLLIPHAQNTVIGNIKFLVETGVPQSRILWLLKCQPAVLLMKLDGFVKIVEEVKGMGLKPSSVAFVTSLHGLRSLSPSTLETKLNVYKNWGWSKEETIAAFGKHPWCLLLSVEKIMKMMDYYVNKMGWDSSFIAKYPLLISLSLEKRVIPRCNILQILVSKGLIRMPRSPTPLQISEKLFLLKFVTAFKKQVPHLLKLYQEQLKDVNCKEKEK